MSNVPRTVFYPKSNSPCMGCEDRQCGCHSKCERNGEWLKECKQQKKKFCDEVVKNKRYEDYVIETIQGFKKGKWRKR